MPKFGVPTDEQLVKINKLAKRTLSSDEVFVFPDKLAGDMIIPDRYVQLTPELLNVFLGNAQRGVSLLIDHSWHADGFWGLGGRPKAAIPYGRTFDASLGKSSVEGETVELSADHYIARGMTIDGISTDDLIAGIEAGTLFDSSIGFNYNVGVCSVCGENYFDSDKCNHIAGKTYEVEGEDKVTRNALCYIQAKPPGALWENSLVFDGAYPTAGVLSKAGDILENEHGIYQVITDLKDIDPEKPVIATYSPRAGLLTMVKKANHQKPFALGGLVAKATASDQDTIFAIGKKLGMSKKQVEGIAQTVLNRKEGPALNENLKKMFAAFGIVIDKNRPIEELCNELADAMAVMPAEEPTAPYLTQEQANTKLGRELTSDQVLDLAKDGEDFRKEVTEAAIAAGVRAQGNDFPAETWKNTFATMGIQAIRDIEKTFQKQAEVEIPAGRKTVPGNQNKLTAQLPLEAYGVK
jgi:hypothetical protein